eukprot:6853766-Prymnesium_polylepis.2
MPTPAATDARREPSRSLAGACAASQTKLGSARFFCLVRFRLGKEQRARSKEQGARSKQAGSTDGRSRRPTPGCFGQGSTRVHF